MKLKGERVASDIVRELGNILIREVKDEDLKKVNITYATVTNDLGLAKVYFNTLDTEDIEKIGRKLTNAAGFFRTELASRLDLRHMPELRFFYDSSIDYGMKIEKIIEEIKNNEEI